MQEVQGNTGMPWAPASVAWYGFQAEHGRDNYLIAPIVDSAPGDAGHLSSGVDGVGDPCRPVMEMDRTYEQDGIKDPALAKFKGCYVMAYTTEIPAAEDEATPGYMDLLPDPGEVPRDLPALRALPGLVGLAPDFVPPTWIGGSELRLPPASLLPIRWLRR